MFDDDFRVLENSVKNADIGMSSIILMFEIITESGDGCQQRNARTSLTYAKLHLNQRISTSS